MAHINECVSVENIHSADINNDWIHAIEWRGFTYMIRGIADSLPGNAETTATNSMDFSNQKKNNKKIN